MKIRIALLIFIVGVGANNDVHAQADKLTRRMTNKKLEIWSVNSSHRRYTVNDTIFFTKATRNMYPLKLKKNGTVERIFLNDNLSCGTLARMEAWFSTHWSSGGSWAIATVDNRTILIIDDSSYRLVDSDNLTFIYLGKPSTD